MEPKDKVQGPAIALMVVAVVGALFQLGRLAWMLLITGLAATVGGGDAWVHMLSGAVGLAFIAIQLCCSALVLMGALKMKNLQSYNWSMISAIVALFPCTSPCCFIGLPVGIWALVVILDAQVKACFADQMNNQPPMDSGSPPVAPPPAA